MRSSPTLASVTLFLVAGLAAADTTPAGDKAQAKPAAQATPADLAKVGDRTITEADVQALIGPQIARMWSEFDRQVEQARANLTSREADLKTAGLDELVARALVEREATARGVSVEELTKTEVDDKLVIAPEEAKSIYDAQKSQPGLAGKSEEEGLKLVEEKLRQKKAAERRQAFVAELRAKGGVRLLYEPERVAVSLDDDPVRGPKDAPITILEFSDFQCPYCGRVEPTLKKIEERYGDKVRLAFRDYPLSFHPFAAKAAEAGSCANQQGKFWELHDILFANQQKLSVEDLKHHAGEAGLDAAAFAKCLDSGQYTEEWKKDLADGNKYGVTGTPAFFINGRFLNGAVPIEKFTAIIDEELERAGIPPPPVAAAAATTADR
jgi:protein-disulfide isomerase